MIVCIHNWDWKQDRVSAYHSSINYLLLTTHAHANCIDWLVTFEIEMLASYSCTVMKGASIVLIVQQKQYTSLCTYIHTLYNKFTFITNLQII